MKHEQIDQTKRTINESPHLKLNFSQTEFGEP